MNILILNRDPNRLINDRCDRSDWPIITGKRQPQQSHKHLAGASVPVRVRKMASRSRGLTKELRSTGRNSLSVQPFGWWPRRSTSIIENAYFDCAGTNVINCGARPVPYQCGCIRCGASRRINLNYQSNGLIAMDLPCTMRNLNAQSER